MLTEPRKRAIRVSGPAHKENIRPGLCRPYAGARYPHGALTAPGRAMAVLEKEVTMTRNHLLKLSARPVPPSQPSVWRMTIDMLDLTFGAPANRRENRR